MAPQPIEAPPAREPRYSLIAAATVVEDQSVRFQQGVVFAPEACAGGGIETIDPGCEVNLTDPFQAGSNPGLVNAFPFVVYHVEECSTFGWRARDFGGRARRALAATRSFHVAGALWDGYDPTRQDGEDGQRYLTAPASDVLTDGPSSAVTVLACLEQGLGTCGRGRRGMIHVTVQTLALMVSLNLLTRDGNLWLTPMGNVVVADAGYTGDGPPDAVGDPRPAGDSQWAYATSWVQLRFSPVVVTPPGLDTPEELQQAVAYATNDLAVVAWQLAEYEWDECCHLAAEVDLPVCAAGGVS